MKNVGEAVGKNVGKFVEKNAGEKLLKLIDTQKGIISLIQSNKDITQTEISEQLNVVTRTVERNMKQLQESNITTKYTYKLVSCESNVHYAVNITWPEIIFDVFALGDYINMALNPKYAKKMCEDLPDEYIKECMEHLPVDCAIINQFRFLVLEKLRKSLSERRYARIKNLMKKNYVDVNRRFSGFCTQYLEELTLQYIDTDKKKREALLASIARKLLSRDEDYYEMENDIYEFARKNDIPISEVRIEGIQWPEEIVW